jgi:hypothetical protein
MLQVPKDKSLANWPSPMTSTVTNFTNLAYYVAQVGKTEGSVEIFRPFDQPATYEKADDSVDAWIKTNERPIVVPFDERTIGDMFSQAKPGICLFNQGNSNVLLDAFTESAKAAKEAGKQLIFTHIDVNSFLTSAQQRTHWSIL